MIDLPNLRPDDRMYSTTQSDSARLRTARPHGVGATLHKRDGSEWWAFVRNAKRKCGDGDLTNSTMGEGRVARDSEARSASFHGEERSAVAERAGRCRATLYRQQARTEEADRDDYRRAFAREAGAVAATDRSVAFNRRLIAALESAD